MRQDLFRRDFTINAMAVSLKGEDFGRLVDFFGGRGRPRAGVVRVLHALSFIDDPTRIFRAIRYENRYGFRMDGHTASLARACVEMNLVGELSSARLRDELQALLSEQRVETPIPRLDELGVAQAIHPHLAADARGRACWSASGRLRAQYAPDVPAWRLRLAVLARRLRRTSSSTGSSGCGCAAATRTSIADAVTVAPQASGAARRRRTSLRRCAGSSSRTTRDGALFALALAGGARPRAARALLRRAPGRPPRDQRRRPGRARRRGVAAGRRDPRRAPAPKAERRARRPRGRAGRGARARG